MSKLKNLTLRFIPLCLGLSVSWGGVAGAVTLEEAIQDIDISGILRYRYDTGRYKNENKIGFQNCSGLISSNQNHRWLGNLNFKANIDDNFKAFIQLRYGPTKEGGYGNSSSNITDTSKSLNVRQLYVEYNNPDYQTSVKAGKQQMDSIWTENYYDGLVATGLKITNTSLDGIMFQAYAYDSYNSDEQGGVGGDMGVYKDYSNPKSSYTQLPIYEKNLYGIAILGNHEILQGNLNSQLWLSYLSENVFFYALNLAYSYEFSENFSINLEGAYLGNTIQSDFEKKVDATNGNFFGAKAILYTYGFDINLGGVHYGDKNKYSITVLEDTGNLNVLGGQQIFYTDGSHLSGDRGENSFIYGGLGYTFDKVRIGADVAYGETKTGISGLGGEKLEFVGKVSYKYSPKLNFLAWYSHINIDTNDLSSASLDSKKNTVRFQTLYKF